MYLFIQYILYQLGYVSLVCVFKTYDWKLPNEYIFQTYKIVQDNISKD